MVSRCSSERPCAFQATTTLARSPSESIDSLEIGRSALLPALSASVRKCSIIRATVAGLNSSVLYSQVVFSPVVRSLIPSRTSNLAQPFSWLISLERSPAGWNFGRWVCQAGLWRTSIA